MVKKNRSGEHNSDRAHRSGTKRTCDNWIRRKRILHGFLTHLIRVHLMTRVVVVVVRNTVGADDTGVAIGGGLKFGGKAISADTGAASSHSTTPAHHATRTAHHATSH